MDFTSCDGCGVVLDLDVLQLKIKTESSKNFDGYIEIHYLECPVCKETSTVEEKDFYNDYKE